MSYNKIIMKTILSIDIGTSNLKAGLYDLEGQLMHVSSRPVQLKETIQGEISFHPETVMGENLLTIKVVGNAFLHSMVRTMVGTLVMVGKGQRDASWVSEVLEARERQAAGENAPAQGLVFWRVIY